MYPLLAVLVKIIKKQEVVKSSPG